jgi:guanosine-3',5'-bis(diphosphate) 3'-pyrophosphohydrolase
VIQWNMATLQKAISLAVEHHSSQIDKAGLPYILHPMRVMLGCKTDEERQIAIMHDLVEDTSVTLEFLVQEGFSQTVVDGVDCLTRRHGETYAEFINRCCENKIAIDIKLLDIADNMDATRLDALSETELDRLKRYHKARAVLISARSRINRCACSQ